MFITTFFGGYAIDCLKGSEGACVYRRIVGGWEFVAEFPSYRQALDFINS